jgi:hypothetical protein
MEIKRSIIEKYLDHVAAYVADHDSLPNTISDYYDYVISMRKLAVYEGELDTLLLGIDCLLLNPSIDTTTFADTYNIYDADEMKELLHYIRAVAFPDAPPLNPETIKDIKFVSGVIFDAEVELP